LQKTPFGSFKGFASTPAAKPNFNFVVGNSTAQPMAEKKSPMAVHSNGTSTGGDKASMEYFHQLKSLNLSVSAWIAKHVKTNPYCILTPVFRDYEKHLAKIEAMRPQQDADKAGINKFVLFLKFIISNKI
jgi:nuclear pore complex protein Nup50